MVTTPHTWSAAERITSANMNYAVAAIGELVDESPNLTSRITALETLDALPLYNGTVTGVRQGANGYPDYTGWPSNGGFTGTSKGVEVMTSGWYTITFMAQCTSGDFDAGGPDQLRCVHYLYKGYDTSKAAESQTTGATVLGVSSTASHGGENMASVTVTVPLSAGDVVTPAWDVIGWNEIVYDGPDPLGHYWARLVIHYPDAICTCRLIIVRTNV